MPLFHGMTAVFSVNLSAVTHMKISLRHVRIKKKSSLSGESLSDLIPAASKIRIFSEDCASAVKPIINDRHFHFVLSMITEL